MLNNDNIRLTVPKRELEFYKQEGLHPIVGALVNGSQDIYYVEIEQRETTRLLLANRHIGMMQSPTAKVLQMIPAYSTGRVIQMNPAYGLKNRHIANGSN